MSRHRRHRSSVVTRMSRGMRWCDTARCRRPISARRLVTERSTTRRFTSLDGPASPRACDPNNTIRTGDHAATRVATSSRMRSRPTITPPAARASRVLATGAALGAIDYSTCGTARSPPPEDQQSALLRGGRGERNAVAVGVNWDEKSKISSAKRGACDAPLEWCPVSLKRPRMNTFMG